MHWRVLLLLFTATCFGAASEPPTRSQILEHRRRQFPGLMQVVEAAQTVPVEFAAQALLRVTESSALTDKVWRRELLEEAFEKASIVKQANPLTIMAGQSALGSREHLLAIASDLKLDRLSLQTRVVRDLLATDPARARELFLTIATPRPRRLTCDDALVDDVASYYDLFASVLNKTTTPEERRKESHIAALNSVLGSVSSPVEIGPALKMLQSVNATPAQLALLVNTVTAVLQRAGGDSRAFHASIVTIGDQAFKLASRLKASQIPIEGFSAAYRQFLVSGLHGTACADVANEKMYDERDQRLMVDFNTQLASANIPAITPEEIKPLKVEGGAKIETVYSQDGMNRLAEEQRQFSKLLFGGTNLALTDADKQSDEWKQRFDDFLKSIDQMQQQPGESEAVFFYRRSFGYSGAVTAAPTGPEKERVFLRYMSFLQSSNFQQEHMAEWFSQVAQLSNVMRSLNPASHEKMLEALRRSGHPVLALHALLGRVTPERPDWASPQPQ